MASGSGRKPDLPGDALVRLGDRAADGNTVLLCFSFELPRGIAPSRDRAVGLAGLETADASHRTDRCRGLADVMRVGAYYIRLSPAPAPVFPQPSRRVPKSDQRSCAPFR